MKIVFLSNYFNHHQQSVCEELNKASDSFYFIATSEMREERRILGYGNKTIPEYVVQSNCENMGELKKKIIGSDFAIIGSAPWKMITDRVRKGKLVFKYSERPFKKGNSVFKYLPRFVKWHAGIPLNKPIYMLCASAYTSYDYSKYFLFKNRAYKWGYFPETKVHNIDLLLKKKTKNRIMWCGRFIEWKHPDDMMKIATRLKKEGYVFEIHFVGTGRMENELRKSVSQNDLDDCVIFHGSMKPEQVRLCMEQAGIYLFTSDRQEGWGAVLNESMNSGCAVVASHAIGSVPFLIKNNENGLIYRSGDIDMLYEKVKYLLDNPDEQVRLGKQAYETIVNIWNAEEAASRLLKLSEKILLGEKYPDLYESGPCSRAEIVKDNWF